MQFYSEGINYYVEIHQSKRELPYLMLFHGFLGSGKVFNHLFASLTQFCNPITIDLVGHGKSEAPAEPELFNSDRQVEQIESILSRLSFENLYGYGYSMGGRLLFQLITKHPDLFKGAVIESSHCGIENESDRNERIKADNQKADSLLSDFNSFIENWLQLPLFGTTELNQPSNYEQIMRSQNPELMAASLKGFGAGAMPSVCKKLQNLKLPLYLIAGEQDAKYAKRMAEIANLGKDIGISIVKGAAHRVHLDQPEELIKIIQSFINKHHV